MNDDPTVPSEDAIAQAVNLALSPNGAPSTNPLIRLFEEEWSHPTLCLLAVMQHDQEVWKTLGARLVVKGPSQQLIEIITAHWRSGLQRSLSLPDVAYYGRQVTKLYLECPIVPVYTPAERQEFLEWLNRTSPDPKTR